MSWVFVNDKLLPADQPAIPAGDHGFLFGDGLFETLAVRGGRPLFLEPHLERLTASAASLSFPAAWRDLPLREGIAAILKANQVQEGFLRLVLSRGIGPRDWDPAGYDRPSLVIYAGSLLPRPAETYQRGWQLAISAYRQDQRSPLCRHKTLSFLHHVLARRAAIKQGADEALHLNCLDNVAEGTTSNVFLVSRGEIVTPDVESGLLPGITRAVALELASRLGCPARQRPVRLAELKEADEVFLTSSLIGIMPAVAIDGQPIGGGCPGPIAARLRQAYQELIQHSTPGR